jgi:hypothetical protein
MSSPRKVVVENNNEKPFGLVIEPWAVSEQINPGQVAVIVDDDDERPLELTLTKGGDLFISVYEDITLSIDGRIILDMRG